MKNGGFWYLTAIILSCRPALPLSAQNIGVFTSLEPTGQTPVLVLPPTHAFQLLAQTGDTLADGSTLKTSPDFTAFVAKNGRNDLGYLSLNHEISNQQGGVTVFDLQFDKIRKIWNITHGLPVDFAPVAGTSRPCSGGVTPWGTVVFGEEYILTSDVDSNRYNDSGWLVEVQPETRQVVQKIWQAGNALHENCAISTDQKTVYWGADDLTHGYLYKYVATEKKHLATGKLYVLVRDDSTATTATWRSVPNETPQECNNINAFCEAEGAWDFSGIEDVEIGPNNKIYFTSKYSGQVWRFKEHGSYVSALEVFVENTTYPIQTASGTKLVEWGYGNDNLAFDNANNLWVLQDGGSNHIWMVKPTHTAAHPQVSLFATTPAGCEPTGITFTPDKRFMFLSFQHPGSNNADTILDVTGRPVVFNRGTTVVIARKEFLGKSFNADSVITAIGSCKKTFEITVFPNPSNSGSVTLFSPAFLDGKQIAVSIFDGAGKPCFTSRYYATHQKITLDFLAKTSGVYSIKVECNGQTGAVPLIVE